MTDKRETSKISQEPSHTESAGYTEAQLRGVTIGEQKPLTSGIVVAEYDPRWPDMFAVEAAKIRTALGEWVVLLEHAGSTSVPGLAAKPIIDIVLVVVDSADEASYVPALEAAGYVLRIREPEWYQHRILRGTDPDVNLHVFGVGCEEVDQMLLMRDWLRENDADRELYAQTKRELAQQNWTYMQNYADAKTEVVQGILARARVARDSERNSGEQRHSHPEAVVEQHEEGGPMESHVNQTELLERLAREHEHLEAVLAQFTPEECMTQKVAGDWMIQDILAHLIAHEQRALQELQSARRGEAFTIDHCATDRFNAEAVQALRGKSYEEVHTMWSASYQDAVVAVRSLSAEDFAPMSLTVTTLGDSIDGALGNNTYEHAAEHRREIESWLQRS